MIKNKRFLSFILSMKWKYFLQIMSLWIVIAVSFVFLSSFSKTAHAETMFYIGGGLGDIEINAKHDQFKSESKNSRRHIILGMDLRKDRYPLRVKLQGTFFATDEVSEKWTSNTMGYLHERRLDINGEALDALAYIIPYTYSPEEENFRLKPFIGGGLVYKRLKLDRVGFKGSMIPLTSSGDEYYFGNQKNIAIGVMPHIGFFLEIPKHDVECSLSLGWSFLAVKSNINYHVVIPGNNELRHPFQIHTSASSIVTGIQIVKNWDSFAAALAFKWEKTQIDDESTFFYTSATGDVYLPFPKFEIIETIGQISIEYLF